MCRQLSRQDMGYERRDNKIIWLSNFEVDIWKPNFEIWSVGQVPFTDFDKVPKSQRWHKLAFFNVTQDQKADLVNLNYFNQLCGSWAAKARAGDRQLWSCYMK